MKSIKFVKITRIINWIVYIIILNLHNTFFLPVFGEGGNKSGPVTYLLERMSIFKYTTSDPHLMTFYPYTERIIIFTITLTLTFLAVDYILRILAKNEDRE